MNNNLSAFGQFASTDPICDKIICFVCTANTCRSPMAAAIMNHYGRSRGYRAISAGLFPEREKGISKLAADALREIGVPPSAANDYPAHVPTEITAEIIEGSYMVYGLSTRHAETLVSRFPQYAGKITILGGIRDPRGGRLHDYIECAKTIRQCVFDTFALSPL